MKIAVIGYSGSGKSTLSRQLGEVYGIPVLHLDTVQFCADWQERDREEARAMVAAFMQRDAWVIDGNYRGFFQEERLGQADRILFLNVSLALRVLPLYLLLGFSLPIYQNSYFFNKIFENYIPQDGEPSSQENPAE